MTTTIEVLKAARADLAMPGAWCQSGFSPSGIAGIETGEAVCAQGAIMRASGDWYGVASLAASGALAAEVRHDDDDDDDDAWTIWGFNMDCTLPELLAAFDAAIAKLEPAPAPELHPLIAAALREPEPVEAGA